MNVLAKHIELLLLEYDCVILPGVGGFIANHNPAFYSPEEHKILPPSRLVAFNQNLTVNDGLLIQTYMQAYDASYPDARRQMEKDIMSLCTELDVKGESELAGIGVLRKDGRGVLTLDAVTSGLLTLDYYGLDAIDAQTVEDIECQNKLHDQIKSVQVLPRVMREGDKENDALQESKVTKDNTLSEGMVEGSTRKIFSMRIPTSVIDAAISVAASIILFFLFAYPSLIDRQNYGNGGFRSQATVVAEQNMKETKAVSKTVKYRKPATNNKKCAIAVENTKADTPKLVASEKKSDIDNPMTSHQVADGTFTIVLASYVTEENAKLFIKKMESNGINDCRFVKQGKVARIIHGCYKDNEEAVDTLRKLRQLNAAFAEAWIRSL